MNHAILNRRADRKPLAMAAKCKTINGMRDEGSISDMSTHGCCITTRGLYFNIGMRVTIKPDGMEAVSGVIRWIAGNRAGVEFDRPLYGPVVEHLTQRNPAGQRVGITHRPY